MARPKPETPTVKTYSQRFKSFFNSHCPYCGADGATLTERVTKKGKVIGCTGHCVVCNAVNNFTGPDILERMNT